MNILLWNHNENLLKCGHYLRYDKNYIYCAELVGNKIKNEYPLIESYKGNFDATVDEEANLHIVCEEKKGSISYLISTAGKWYKKVVWKREVSEVKISQMRLIICRGSPYIIFTAGEEQKSSLYIQKVGEGHVAVKCETFEKYTKNFSVAVDKYENIHMFYSLSSYEFGHRMYCTKKDIIGSFKSILKSKVHVTKSFVTIDEENLAHVVLSKTGQLSYFKTKLYENKTEFLGNTLNEVFFRYSTEKRPTIALISNKLWISFKNKSSRFVLVNSAEEKRTQGWKLMQRTSLNANSDSIFKVCEINKKFNERECFCYGSIRENSVEFAIPRTELNEKHVVSRIIAQNEELIYAKKEEEYNKPKVNTFPGTNVERTQKIALEKINITLETLKNQINKIEKSVIKVWENLNQNREFTAVDE